MCSLYLPTVLSLENPSSMDGILRLVHAVHQHPQSLLSAQILLKTYVPL